jgi:hypothetical protein
VVKQPVGRRRHRALAPTVRDAVLLVVLPVLLFLPGLIGGLIAPGDGWVKNFPVRYLVAERVRSGHLPTWSSLEFSGAPILAFGQYGVLYLPDRLLGLLPGIAAYDLSLIFALALGGVGAYLVGLHWGTSRAGALLAAIAFTYNPYMWSEVTHLEMLASVAWLPWALLGLGIARTPGRRVVGVTMAGVAFGMCAYAGHPQMVAACALMIAAWSVGWALLGATGRLRHLVDGALSLVIGAGLAAAQLLPTLLFLGASARADFPYAKASSLAPEGRQLPLVLFPYASGGGGGLWHTGSPLQFSTGFPFFGVVALVLAAGTLPLWRRDRRIAIAWLIAIGILVVSLSPVAPPLGHLVYRIPIFERFRAWPRFTVVTRLLVALLAGVTVSKLQTGSIEERRSCLRWSGLAAALYVVVGAGLAVLPVLGVRRMAGLVVPVVLALVVGGLLILTRRRLPVRAAAWCLVALVAIESLALSRPSFPDQSYTVVSRRVVDAALAAPAGRYVHPAAGGVDRYLFVGSFTSANDQRFPRAPLTGLSGAHSVNGYDPLASQTYLDLLGMDFYGQVPDAGCLVGGRWASDALDLLRVTTLIAPHGSAQATEISRLGRTRRIAGTDLVRVDRTPRVADAFAASSATLHQLNRPGLALGCGEVDLGRPQPVRSARTDTGRITLRTTFERQRVVVVSESFDRGWQATVDGRPTRVQRAGPVMAISVPAGRHRVELRYVARGLRAGIAISAATVLLLVAVGLIGRRQRRSTRRRGAEDEASAGESGSAPQALTQGGAVGLNTAELRHGLGPPSAARRALSPWT